MSKKYLYLKEIPMTLQEDFVNRKVIPIVGSGFSKNAILPQGKSLPDWNELGIKIKEYITDYKYVNPVDALSIFESEFSRVKLIEILAKILYVNDIKPGDTHKAFCNIFFDTICTTNFDFLIEHTLHETNRPHSIIVTEDRLPINTHEETKLIKLHGDFNHPQKMIITEKDFDTYLEKNKVLSTYISNLFITKTLFLIGYSFDDPDIRGLWQIINDRLGQLSRPAYTVMVDASPIEISRFERRNIKVINLKGSKAKYPEILYRFFSEIKEMIDEKSSGKITVTNEKAQEEIILSSNNNRLCFISAPLSRISFLKEMLYPVLFENQITPITLDEVIMPSDNWMTKSETLLKESAMAIVDASGNSASVMWELGVIMDLKKKLIIIADKEQFQGLPNSISNYDYLLYNTNKENEEFISCFNEKLISLSRTLIPKTDNEPSRLLNKNEYDAAVISAFRILESSLREYLHIENRKSNISRPVPLIQMLGELRNTGLPKELLYRIEDFISIRNRVVHTSTTVDKKTATDIVKTVNNIIKYIKTGYETTNN